MLEYYFEYQLFIPGYLIDILLLFMEFHEACIQ